MPFTWFISIHSSIQNHLKLILNHNKVKRTMKNVHTKTKMKAIKHPKGVDELEHNYTLNSVL